MTEPMKDCVVAIKERFSSPVFGPIYFAMLLWNYDVLGILFFGMGGFEERLFTVQEHYFYLDGVWQGGRLGWPVLVGIAFSILSPWLNWVFLYASEKAHKGIKGVKDRVVLEDEINSLKTQCDIFQKQQEEMINKAVDNDEDVKRLEKSHKKDCVEFATKEQGFRSSIEALKKENESLLKQKVAYYYGFKGAEEAKANAGIVLHIMQEMFGFLSVVLPHYVVNTLELDNLGVNVPKEFTQKLIAAMITQKPAPSRVSARRVSNPPPVARLSPSQSTTPIFTVNEIYSVLAAGGLKSKYDPQKTGDILKLLSLNESPLNMPIFVLYADGRYGLNKREGYWLAAVLEEHFKGPAEKSEIKFIKDKEIENSWVKTFDGGEVVFEPKEDRLV